MTTGFPPPPTASGKPLPIQMLDCITGYWVSCGVHVSARLSIADHLAKGPRSVADLAKASGAHSPTLYRLLRMLASHGIFRETDDGRFENTPLSGTLRADVPASMKPFALMMVDGPSVAAWNDLLATVRTGEEAFQRVHGMGGFEYMAAHPDKAREFGEAMTSISGMENPAIAEAYDFKGIRKIVDVGGGHGSLLAAILARNPQLQGVVFDRAEVVENAKKDVHVRAKGVEGRIELVAGNFFDAVPAGADAYVMKYILHDWNDEQSRRILENCRKAMAKGGRVLVLDNVIPKGNDPYWGKMLDMNMLVLTPGRERTEAEFRDLFASAGLKLARIVPTACPLSVVEGFAA
jgi:SAM-dependent methyltransferase